MITYELAIAMFNSQNPLGARIGDIVASRPILGEIGTVERRLFLWTTVQSNVEAGLKVLGDHWYVDEKTQFIIRKKFRYSLPYEQMLKIWPQLDVARAIRADEIYQPSMFLELSTGKTHYHIAPIQPEGIIVDASSQRVLEPHWSLFHAEKAA